MADPQTQQQQQQQPMGPPRPPQPQSFDERYVQAMESLISAITDLPQWPQQNATKVGKLWWMVDFIGRTLHMFDQLKITSRAQQKELRRDIAERTIFQEILITDTTGKLSMMTMEQPGRQVDFGEEVVRRAKLCNQVMKEANFGFEGEGEH
ncbi:hypothetical protein BDY21DRAFT_369459 [Lineolata rhizophorae]|uniref:Uncharacterized protein n=1 Tax=Lineolata rhizophorae TaxID=578093 RepID=A0A6A6P9I2_9PEZI|nr:hypothetical protein BDY21DRAFT_369459 [Lineolata rhizophorae]